MHQILDFAQFNQIWLAATDDLNKDVGEAVKDYYREKRDKGFTGGEGVLRKRTASGKMIDRIDGHYDEWLKQEKE